MRLGTDPEVFLVNTTGKFIAVNGLINADKWNPLQIPDMEKGFTLQEDNVALEYGIPPCASSEEFVTAIKRVMVKSRDWLPGLDFSRLSCTVFTDDQLEHPMARIFGCEPDFNAYTRKANPKPRPRNRGTRSAGGHIHVETTENPFIVAQAMDVFLGIPSIIMDPNPERRELYGKAGAIRIKEYGVEYRSLSNFWIFEDRLIDWVWRNTARALENLDNLPPAATVQACINNNDELAAWAIISDMQLEVL